MSNFVGIDPSYSKTGVCRIDVEAKEIVFTSISPKGTNKTYADAVHRALYIADNIIKFVDADSDISYVLEEPLVMSQMASRLGILSGVIITTLKKSIHPHNKIYTVNPVGITQLNSALANREKLTKKQLSMKIATDILEYLESEGFNIKITALKYNKDGSSRKRKLSHDEAEALLLTLLLIHKLECEDFKKYWEEIYKINKGFRTKNVNILAFEVNSEEQ